MPGSQGAVGRGIHLDNDRERADLQGAEAGVGAIPKVQEVYGKWFTGDTPPNPARSGERGVGTGGQ